jgi:hypothetical protein
MAQNDNAVVTAAQGFVFTAPVGTAAPTPAELDTVNPVSFGSQVQTVSLTGTATSGTFTLTVDEVATSALAYNVTAPQVQSALEALSTVGAGNVLVTGTVSAGLVVTFVGAKQGVALPLIEADDANLVGTTPVLAVTITTAPNGWVSVGHTSRDDMPEFGFDGGDTEVKGTWQNEALKEVATGDPLADFVTVMLQQLDLNSFELYYGENASVTPGVFGVAGGQTQPNEKAFLVIIVDGPVRIGFYAPKASVKRDDSIEIPVDGFAGLPIRATFLDMSGRNRFEWISLDLFGAA